MRTTRQDQLTLVRWCACGRQFGLDPLQPSETTCGDCRPETFREFLRNVVGAILLAVVVFALGLVF